jgi:hypothetical protein
MTYHPTLHRVESGVDLETDWYALSEAKTEQYQGFEISLHLSPYVSIGLTLMETQLWCHGDAQNLMRNLVW